MAKGNLFQGMARGKVGDVVFSRLNGQQISRVRNRRPKNPRTNAQLYQRAIMATIMQAYSAGKIIFDHSFQGKSVSEGNMRTFMSRNIKTLRGTVAQEVNDGIALAKQVGHVVAPGAITPVPVAGLIVSEGSLVQNLFGVNAATSTNNFSITTPAVAGSNDPANQWAAANGLVAGEIFTFVAFVNNSDVVRYKLEGSTGAYGTQYNCEFGWLRLIVKNEIATTSILNATLGDIFEIQQDGSVFSTKVAALKFANQTFNAEDLFGATPTGGTIACIRSREDSKERSSEQMVEMTANAQYGLVSSYALEAWQKGTDMLGNSDLILEGGLPEKGGLTTEKSEADGDKTNGSTNPAPPAGGGD